MKNKILGHYKRYLHGKRCYFEDKTFHSSLQAACPTQKNIGRPKQKPQLQKPVGKTNGSAWNDCECNGENTRGSNLLGTEASDNDQNRAFQDAPTAVLETENFMDK